MTTCLLLISALVAQANGLTTGPVETLGEDYKFTEGPLWLPGEGIIFSDIPADTVYREDGTAYRQPSGKSNGLVLDMEGRLIACEHGNRRVTRTEKDGSITVLAHEYLGRKLNSPNDVAVRSDGAIFFTDPPYGLEERQQELPFCGVYVILPDGSLHLLSVYFSRPNGVVLSPDEKTLYVADSGDSFIQAFDVAEDGRLTNSRLFCEGLGPDGMDVDERGNIWVSARDGVRVYTPQGKLLETIVFPQQPANCTFGGQDFNILYVTARTGFYKVPCRVRGWRPVK